ncbi:MAG: hypothetical protein K6U03_01285 [Firmicutes bacterium]|nr:hypothetical protein [Bacillota bacterium]
MKEVLVSADTIVTPAAKDWANDHDILLIYERKEERRTEEVEDRDQFLRHILYKIANEFQRCGQPLTKETFFEAVWLCLERIKATDGTR